MVCKNGIKADRRGECLAVSRHHVQEFSFSYLLLVVAFFKEERAFTNRFIIMRSVLIGYSS